MTHIFLITKKQCVQLKFEREVPLQVRIDFPFTAQFEFADPGNNSRELRTQALQMYLINSGMELGRDVEDFKVSSYTGDDNGEFWIVKAGNF